ncbi:hypothetical protein [Burkholderia gladioli]|uniref:hypothetical protein n=1 Tax=Burkholderia gladioli TaxID=28095 RepID=UPI00163F46E0|nr:hypothetical protein [Burkholderia gladioli]
MLNTLDAAEYLKQFLADPQPAVRWIGRNQIERFPRPGGRSSASSRRVAATRREARGCLACFGLSTSSWHGLPVQSDTSCRIPLRSSRTISWLRLNFEIMRGIEYQISKFCRKKMTRNSFKNMKILSIENRIFIILSIRPCHDFDIASFDYS